MKIKNTLLYGRSISHIGSLEDRKILLMIGRSDFTKGSVPLQTISLLLSLQDHTLLWYGTEIPSKSSYFKKIVKFLIPGLYLQKIIRNLLSAVLLIPYPSRWNYIWANTYPIVQNNGLNTLYHALNETKKLRQFIQCLGQDKEIIIVSHSSGGRISSSIANLPTIKKLVCFGYPFKHPTEPEDVTRTLHLEEIQTPFLIIQGKEDEYGGTDIDKHYNLSSSVTLLYVNTDHDFNHITDEEWMRIATRINKFLVE
ncbi:MAG: hypothetical protein M0P91_13100 [Sulfuricurvum sp.]|jgi:hypothetical protein|uniref:alpha/beta family hydrolase n=1 Tax=Sulfuricurvum sp. TaxID=2025608 RepID=UPI0025E2CECD|nr:alpha/beta family hydrolase [Sulfuricurvum sp.]MCK9374116.1 hypothetical protein [Sulfuricurvum sp.]